MPFFPIPLESEERPSPQIPLESEGTRSRGKYRGIRQIRDRVLSVPYGARSEIGPRKERKERNLRSFFTKEKRSSIFFPSSPPIPKESEETRFLLFLEKKNLRFFFSRNKRKRGSPQHVISNFLGRSRTSKFEDRSENRMRFSERSRICLIPRRHAPANPFGGDPIACNLLLSPENRMRFSGDRGDKSEIRVAGRGKRQIQRIWTFVSFIQTARHANLTFVPPVPRKSHAIFGGQE